MRIKSCCISWIWIDTLNKGQKSETKSNSADPIYESSFNGCQNSLLAYRTWSSVPSMVSHKASTHDWGLRITNGYHLHRPFSYS